MTTAQEAAREILRQYRERILERSAGMKFVTQEETDALWKKIGEELWEEVERNVTNLKELIAPKGETAELEIVRDMEDAVAAANALCEGMDLGTTSLDEFASNLSNTAVEESPLYVYIAGPLSDFPAQYLSHASRMSREARWCMEQGWVPFNPAADLIEGLMSVKPMPEGVYQKRSMDMLRLIARAERRAIYVVGDRHYNGALSRGVFKEMVEAKHLGIPICRSRDELIAMQDFYNEGTWEEQ